MTSADGDFVAASPSGASAPLGAHQAATILQTLELEGYVVVQDCLPSDVVRVLHDHCRHLEERHGQLGQGSASERHPPGWTEIPRLIERCPPALHLATHPLARYLASDVLGPDFELASACELDIKNPGEPLAHCGWHTDFIWIPKLSYPKQVFWLACYYFLSDIDLTSGPLVVLPGSHRFDRPPDPGINDESGRGLPLPGARALTGRAGTAAFFNNEIWHMSAANRSDRARRMIKIHYKPSWMKPWGGGRAISPAFSAGRTDPVLRQLLGLAEYDDVEWQYGTDAHSSRYPASMEACEAEAIADWTRGAHHFTAST
jgi:hypothetical protein